VLHALLAFRPVDVAGQCPHVEIARLAAMLAPATSASASGYWQTPVADDAVNRARGKFNSRGEPKLSAQAMQWPTPTVHGNHNRKGASESSGDGLATAVKQWPTPTSCKAGNETRLTCSGDGRAKPNKIGWAVATYPTATSTQYKGWSPNHNRADSDDRLDYTIERQGYEPSQDGPIKRLNPDWVEWLMGWPVGWTSLKPLLGGIEAWLARDSHWDSDPADEPDAATPRVAGGVRHRQARLKAIGNGQVPQCAAMAFVKLFERLQG
jgi:hypothetical protein